ncbi:MAG: hypothetical protein DCF30_02170 [Hyphomicrobiales bacterium]|nr:MAG: hypothetical protein DCF30_02170 [Hyphomicrobiales bacterium]
MIRGFLPRLRSIATGVLRFMLETQITRLATMAVPLWPRVRLLSVLVALLAIACVVLAVLSARTVFVALAPASPVGAWVVAILAALVVLELCAFTAIAGIEAVLQLAHDFGRHRVGVLLALATIVAALAAFLSVPDTAEISTEAWVALCITATLLVLTGWFQRTYRRPARRGFRDFHVDVIDARQFLARAVHGG